ncbi:hypothetical protein N7467_009824 [Penicillium canescens]|nr:hypothetical protein N7467_009824 [Penicillium canescens]
MAGIHKRGTPSGKQSIPNDVEGDTYHAPERTRYYCEFPDCGKSYTTQGSLTQHRHTHSSEWTRYYCEFPNCGKSFATKGSLKEHGNTHSSEWTRYYCEFPNCGKSFATKGSLTQHRHTHSSEWTRHYCEFPDCGKSFTTKGSLTKHRHTHSSEQTRYYCEFPNCGKSFTAKRSLTKHRHTHSSERTRYYCEFPDCGKSFTTKRSLKDHGNTHSSERTRYYCEFPNCGKSFATKGSLKDHGNTHSSERTRYYCEFPNCGKSFATKGSLKEHGNTHSSERTRYYCEFPNCGKSFTAKSSLNSHVRVDHNPEPTILSCEFPGCSSTFHLKQHLARHRRIHDRVPKSDDDSVLGLPIDPTLLGVNKNLESFVVGPVMLVNTTPLPGPLTLFVARASSGSHDETTQRLERSLAELEASWINHHGPIRGSSRFLTMIIRSNVIPTQATSYIRSIKAALSQLTVKGVTIVFTGYDSLFTTQEGNRKFLCCFDAMTDLEIFYLEKESNGFYQLCPSVMKGLSNGDDLTIEWVERANQIGQIKRDMAVTAKALSDAAGKRNKSKKRKRQ